jgi:4,5-dihydroxyphthalate decarboxylase
MVRELQFDVSEMAIGTFIQAKAYGKRLALLPVVTLSRFQETAMLCLAESAIREPADLKGRRVGVRAYSQTTGLWLRGTLADVYGVAPESIDWITFEGAHVAEFRDPSFVRRAKPGEALLPMLRENSLDAAIFGADAPSDLSYRCVFPDPQASAKQFLARHGFTPVNHMLCVKQSLADERPDIVQELIGMFREAAQVAGDKDVARFSRAAINPALELAARYAAEQRLTDRQLGLTEIWGGATI